MRVCEEHIFSHFLKYDLHFLLRTISNLWQSVVLMLEKVCSKKGTVSDLQWRVVTFFENIFGDFCAGM